MGADPYLEYAAARRPVSPSRPDRGPPLSVRLGLHLAQKGTEKKRDQGQEEALPTDGHGSSVELRMELESRK